MMAAFNNVVLLTADAISVVSAFSGSQWGIFLNGVQVVGQDIFSAFISNVTGFGNGSFLDLDYHVRYAISEYPVEQGAFQSYNKVQSPFDVAITIAAGGSTANRTLLLTQIEAIIGSTDLYTVMMPEGSLNSVNPIAYGYRRQHDRGLGLLEVNILFKQVRPAGNPTFSTIQTPGNTPASAPSTGGPAPITSPTPAFTPSTSQTYLGIFSATMTSPSVAAAVTGGL
jgi:hypothetical protein